LSSNILGPTKLSHYEILRTVLLTLTVLAIDDKSIANENNLEGLHQRTME